MITLLGGPLLCTSEFHMQSLGFWFWPGPALLLMIWGMNQKIEDCYFSLSLFHSLLSSSPIPPCHSVSLSNKSIYKEKEQSKTELCQMQIHIRCPVKLEVSHFCFSSVVINCVVIMVVASIGNVSLHSCGLVSIYMILLTITKALR